MVARIKFGTQLQQDLDEEGLKPQVWLWWGEESCETTVLLRRRWFVELDSERRSTSLQQAR